MLYLGCDLRAAIFWITERFQVPFLPPGSHVKKRTAWFPRFHSGVDENVVTLLVRSGIWSEFSHAERSILPALVTFTDRESGAAEVSYRGLMRYSGVGSEATIAAAIRRFEQMHFLRVVRIPGGPRFRRVNQYILTPDDPKFQALMTKVYQRERDEIDLEKQLRAEARRKRGQAVLPV
jgi:hypothetical protein